MLESTWDAGTYALRNHSQGAGWWSPGAKRRKLILLNYWADQVVMFYVEGVTQAVVITLAL